MKRPVLLIGGSGFADQLKGERTRKANTFGQFDVFVSIIGDRQVYAVKRHGDGHMVPPHKVNYRAHIWAARELGAEAIIASTACGVVIPRSHLLRVTDAPGNDLLDPTKTNPPFSPGDLALCRDLIAINLTMNGGPITFYDHFPDGPKHADMGEVFNRKLNAVLLAAASECGIMLKQNALVTTTMGPRYETPAEVKLFSDMDVTHVGMTTAYEAILARELGIPYTVVTIGTNWGAGITSKPLSHDEVVEVMASKSADLLRVVSRAIEKL